MILDRPSAYEGVDVKILLLTAGTRGDVEPFAVLARRAADSGHAVRLGVPDNSGAHLAGLNIASLGVDFRPLIESQGVSPLLAIRAFRSYIRPAMRRMLANALRLIVDERPDVIVAHPKVLTAPLGSAHLGIPFYWVETVPSWTPTSEFPAPGIPLSGSGPINRLTYRIAGAAGAMFRRETEAATRAAGIKPATPAVPAGSFVPASPQILGRPRDWPPTTYLTGAWAVAGNMKPAPTEIGEFADKGPFLYAGFGSMAAGDPEMLAKAIIDSARDTGHRVLLATGWGGLRVPADREGDDVLQVDTVDHPAVLPLALMAIHHGGAGTTHAAAAAGIPSIVVPFVADQPFWARQLAARGLAPAPIPYKKLTRERLTPAIAEALELRANSAKIGALVREEDGPGAALKIIETTHHQRT